MLQYKFCFKRKIYYCVVFFFSYYHEAETLSPIMPRDMLVEIVSYCTIKTKKNFTYSCKQALGIVSDADNLRHFRSIARWRKIKDLTQQNPQRIDKENFLDNSFNMFHMKGHWAREEFERLYDRAFSKEYYCGECGLDTKLYDFFCYSLDYLDCMFTLQKSWPLSPFFLRMLYDISVENSYQDRIDQWASKKISPFCNATSSHFISEEGVKDATVALFIYKALGNEFLPLMHMALKVKRQDNWLGVQCYRFLLERATDYPEYNLLSGEQLFDNQYHLKHYILTLPSNHIPFVKNVLKCIVSTIVDVDSEVARNSLYALDLLATRPG